MDFNYLRSSAFWILNNLKKRNEQRKLLLAKEWLLIKKSCLFKFNPGIFLIQVPYF